MNVLLLGARGFIGRHLAHALREAGHTVVEAVRPAMDLARDREPDAWRPRLEGIDVVVNAAGLFGASVREMEAVHATGPIALFEACAQAGVRVVQVSALGADEEATTPFHRTKRAADEALLALSVPAVVLQPSLVYGPDGESARLFTALASLPIVPLPGSGEQQVQPVHVDDVVAAVVAILREGDFPRERVPLVGPRPVSLRVFLQELRLAMGLSPARFLQVPPALVRGSASWGIGLLDRDALSMLERGNTADPGPITRRLGRAPRAYRDFIDAEHREAVLAAARLAWLAPILRVAIAAVWLVAGVVSAGLYPVEQSYALLAQVGITGVMAPAALYGAAALDFLLGIATLVMRRRRWLWIFQMALIAAYTAIITVALPEQWLHPFGPVVKNLPMLAAIALLSFTERR